LVEFNSREVLHISTCDSASEGSANSNVSSSDDNSIASSTSSVVPTGPDSVGPPDFVPRKEGDVLSKYDRPSIIRDTPPLHMRYRKKEERKRKREGEREAV
jgi:hypothetical protein